MSKADKSLSAKAEKSDVSLATLRKVYRRGVAAWNSGHRPGTTPQQWGHARVNSYINKGKTYHTADKDLRNESLDINTLFEMQLVGTDEYRKHAIAMTPGQNQEIEDAFPVTSPNQSPIAPTSKSEEHDCGCEGDCECDEMSESVGSGHSGFAPISFREFRNQLQEYALSQAQAEAQSEEDEEEEEGENDGVNDGVDFLPTLKRHKPENKRTAPSTMSIRPTLDGLPVTTQFATYEEKQPKRFMPTPRQVPAPKEGHPVPAGWERVRTWGGAFELRRIPDWKYQKSVIRIGQTGHDEKLKKTLKLKEAVEYHLENKISFTENVFRPGSDMFFEMINEAKRLYTEGQYTPADEWEVDMLNSDIGEKAMYEGQEVILDYPFIEDIEQINEVFNTVYPHTYHGTLRPEDPKSENGPEHLYLFRIPGKGNLRHTYSVSINRFQGEKGNLSFGYHGKQPADFVPVGKYGDRKYFESGEHEVTGEGGGKASSIISTVKSIARTHAKKHGLNTMVFAGSSDEPSRTKLYSRIAKRMGGEQHSSEDDEHDPHREYSIPVREDSDPTKGKGIGKPWREGGGGAVYVRTGDGGVKKVRFSQSGMAKKFNEPARVRSFVARHRCLTNKDKTSASYWACRWPRYFSNSGQQWW